MASTAKKALKGSGKRRHFGGKCVDPSGSPRSHTHGGHSQATAGFTCGDTALKGGMRSNSPKLSPYRVTAPTKRAHRRGFYRSAS